MTIEYKQTTELPDLQVTWKDSTGTVIPFVSQPHTFSFRVASVPSVTVGTLGGSQTGITLSDAAPNVTVAFAAGTFDSPAPGTYSGQLWARRTSDSKDRQPVTFDFTVGAAI